MVRVKGPMIAMAVNMEVTSDRETELSDGRWRSIHVLHLVCCMVGAIIM
jgi:hypothetical protein